MQFTDVVFGVFLTVVFLLYWLALRRSVKAQNVLLLTASYLFYGWWDWRFLILIIVTTVTTYFSAHGAGGRYGKILTAANVALNLGILVVFKYLGFFAENLARLFSLAGINLDWFTIDVLLPVGISFYTFQAISYSVDAYKGKVEPCRDPLAFATFIAYFPQLVAGPIERAEQLLPQIERPRAWRGSYAVSGLRMILFGVMKKVCVADMLAIYTDRFYDAGFGSAWAVLAAGFLFSFQIYFDFSAYSEIARGVSRLLGIELMVNFKFPYFSRNIAEFWRRWHISLMWWFRDYVYIPLGGSRRGLRRTVVNCVVIFLLSGLWHGAAWNFIVWGAYWAVVYTVARYVLNQNNIDRPICLRDMPAMFATFGVVSFGFYIFRCDSMADVLAGLRGVWLYVAAYGGLWIAGRLLCRSRWLRVGAAVCAVAAVAAVVALLLPGWYTVLKLWWLVPWMLVELTEWRCRNLDYPLERMCASRGGRIIFYWMCIFLVILSEPVDMPFIYFQF